MPDSLAFKILENISEKEFQKNSDLVVQNLLNNITTQLKLDPYQTNIKFIIIRKEISESKDVFNIGVNRYTQNKTLIIEIYEKYLKFLPFILLREIYNRFVPLKIIDYESVQLVINQIIIKNLSKHNALNEWDSLIKGHLEHYDAPSKGFDRLTPFDRLKSFFDLKVSEILNHIRFFFHYIRRNISLMSDKIEDAANDLHDLFFDEFKNHMLDCMTDKDMIETVRCLIYIFYKIKLNRNLGQYQNYFQKLKANGQLQTELSLRRFIKNLEWIKNESYIAPSYKVNWKTLDICVIYIFIRFNPILNKAKIYKIIKNLPFLTTSKFSRSNFSLDLLGIIFIPKVYLEDLINLVKRLENLGYIIKHDLLLLNYYNANFNLNYLRKSSQKQLLVELNHSKYEKKYEIEFKLDYGTKFYKPILNILDFLLLDRIPYYSVTGLGFERKAETLKTFKSDLLSEISTERAKIKDLKIILNSFNNSEESKAEILKFLKINKYFGFFYIKMMLEDCITLIGFIEGIIMKNPEITSFSQIQNALINQQHSHLIEENIILNNNYAKNIILKEVFSFYFSSKEILKKNIEKYKQFYALFNSCHNLRLFDLNAIKKILLDKDLVNTIYQKKDDKLRNSYEKYRLYKITSQKIDDILEKFLAHKPPIIKPNLINTVIFIQSYNFLHLILIDSSETRKKLNLIKVVFQKFFIFNVTDIITNKNLLYVELRTSFLSNKEKEQLYSIIYNYFKENIVYGKSYLWSGFTTAFSLKNYYDFHSKQFFYTKDLFEQYFLSIQKLLGESLKIPQDKPTSPEKFWSRERNISNLIKTVNERVSREHIDFNISHLNKLLDLHLNLEENLLDIEKFKEIKLQYFFKNYIKSIKFIPAFQHFGFSQSYLYLYPTDLNKIDLKLLLMNTFQNVKYPACLDDSNSFLIKYIMPYNIPNVKYLNCLTKTKQVIREYCLFSIKKIIPILRFDYNLGVDGWTYKKDEFKKYLQNILFNPNYNISVPKLKEFEIANNSDTPFTPESLEYDSLTQIYDYYSIDIKSYLGTRNYKTIKHIIDLLKKNLIFPYLSLKNLNLHEKISIIIPNLKPELNETLIKIFNFFNYGFIYEIKGEYFIYGFPQEVQFQNGLMIKLYLPKCELHEFVRLFDLLFEYLEIKDYLILNDLIDGKQLIKSIFGKLDFLKKYNPLKNLKWNEEDKIWMNHKLFTEKFEPIYPDLILKEKK